MCDAILTLRATLSSVAKTFGNPEDHGRRCNVQNLIDNLELLEAAAEVVRVGPPLDCGAEHQRDDAGTDAAKQSDDKYRGVIGDRKRDIFDEVVDREIGDSRYRHARDGKKISHRRLER